MRPRGPSHSAPYGQACMQCFKSKSKCVLRPNGEGCERCHRLHQHCRPSDGIRKRNTQRNQDANAKVAQLENRVDGLLSLLQSVATSSDPSAALRNVLEEQGVVSHGQQQHHSVDAEPLFPTPDSTITMNLPVVADCDSRPAQIPRTYSPLRSIDNSTDSYPPSNEPSGDEAETYLNVFRSHMIQFFPFIHLPPDVTAQQLQQDRPFLLRAIIAVASPSTEQKLTRGRELKRIVAETALLENRSSVDLLLGLLIYVAWGNDQFLNRSGTLSRLMMLAMSLVYDLRLNKRVPPDVHMVGAFIPGFEGCDKDAGEESQRLLLERQRAVLGCFVLSSIVSSYFAQMDAMRWTAQMEEALRAISANKDCPTDSTFAFQVRLQLLAQKAILVRQQSDIDLLSPGTPLPTILYLKVLQGQLQDLRDSITPSLQAQEILLLHTHYITLHLNETAHPATSPLPLIPPSPTSTTTSFTRLESLWRSLHAIRAFFEIFFAQPPSSCLGFSFLTWAQLARCVVVLYRLSVLEDPAWDREAVRDVLDVFQVVERIAGMLEGASGEGVLGELGRVMRVLGGRMRGEGGEGGGDDEGQGIDFGNDFWAEELLGGRF